MLEHVLEYWPRMVLSWRARSVLPLVSWLLPRLVFCSFGFSNIIVWLQCDVIVVGTPWFVRLDWLVCIASQGIEL